MVAAKAAEREVVLGSAPGKGQPDLCRRGGLYRVEDQPPCRDRHRAEAVATEASAPRRAQPLAAPAEERGDQIARANSVCSTLIRRLIGRDYMLCTRFAHPPLA